MMQLGLKLRKICSNRWFATHSKKERFASSNKEKECAGLQNPLQDMNKYVQKPIIPSEDLLFKPRDDEVKNVQQLFRSSTRSEVSTVRGVANYEKLPVSSLPEVAFAGRSNVGKSSLIKAIFFNPDVKISISKTPGHTTVLKLYKTTTFGLMDTPGYGENMPSYFEDCVENYLQNRKSLMRTMLLVDALVGLSEWDKIGLKMMEEFSLPYCVVLTKIDTCTQSQLVRTLASLRKYQQNECQSCFPQPFLTSSTTLEGIAFLRAFIAHVTGNLSL